MATLESLAKKLNRLADRLDDEVRAAKVETAMAVMGHLVEETPVDTSEALSNWQGSTGSIPGRIGPLSPGEAGSSQAASASAALAAARAVFEAAPVASPLVISNVVPYIQRLNEGWSKQHPGGFVEAAVLVGRSVLRRRRWFRGR